MKQIHDFLPNPLVDQNFEKAVMRNLLGFWGSVIDLESSSKIYFGSASVKWGRTKETRGKRREFHKFAIEYVNY